MAVSPQHVSRLIRIAGMRRDLSLARLAETAAERQNLVNAREELGRTRREAVAAALAVPGYLALAAKVDQWARRRDEDLLEAIAATAERQGRQSAVAARDLGRTEVLKDIAERLDAERIKLRARRQEEAS